MASKNGKHKNNKNKNKIKGSNKPGATPTAKPAVAASAPPRPAPPIAVPPGSGAPRLAESVQEQVWAIGEGRPPDKVTWEHFHNPYHFIPMDSPSSADWHSIDDLKSKAIPGATHARFDGSETDPRYTGRLLCTLTTLSPTFIGGKREASQNNQPARSEPFKVGYDPAIPASSLRGMLSSLIEAGTSSAMRVLDRDRTLTRRAQTSEALSAMGLVCQQPDGTFRLVPLCLPTMEQRGGGYEMKPRYRHCFEDHPGAVLRILIDDKEAIDCQKANHGDTRPFFYMKAAVDPELNGRTVELGRHFLPRHPTNKNGAGEDRKYLIGARPKEPKVYQDPPGTPDSVRGILYVMRDGTRPDIPNTKKHELFIPFPEGIENERSIPLPQHVITTFQAMAEERYLDRKNEKLPYHPLGTLRNLHESDNQLRVKDGDIVYFRPTEDGKEVESISYSAIWRENAWLPRSLVQERGHGAAKLGDFFDQELLPFHAKRQRISFAERLWGFVQQNENDDGAQTLALKGRVRPTHALICPSHRGTAIGVTGEIVLRILSAPKPPSPSLYFKRRNGGTDALGKPDFTFEAAEPQGRKWYLHHPKNGGPLGANGARTQLDDKDADQKVAITPIKPGRSFYFALDFENLTTRELQALCWSIRPTERFRHRIGMAKSLGLGSVALAPAGLFLIDWKRRYTEDDPFQTTPYHDVWSAPDALQPVWPEEFKRERRAAVQHSSLGTAPSPIDLADEFHRSLAPDIRHALDLLGDPGKVTAPVHTPQIRNEPLELETYKWFDRNERPQADSQSLQPLNADSEALPTLETVIVERR